MKKVFIFTIKLFFVIFFVVSLTGFSYISYRFINSENPEIKTILDDSTSVVLDTNGDNITSLNLTSSNSVSYSDLPDVFINALISAEDARFFNHSGVDFQRIISALISNLKGNKLQGASTLTQQLIKNIYLDSSKTLDRKIEELILALKLENDLSKEDILLAYCNNIMFDGVTLGVNSASLKLFNKPINNVNLAESALLAGLVNAPSYYNPIRNPVNAKKRMDIVLDLMYRHNYISNSQLSDAKKVQISDLIQDDSSSSAYPYQAYLDIVYKEVINKTGYNPLTTPLIIETTMNKELQTMIDSIQNNEDEEIKFSDSNQQIGASVIDNKTGAIIAVSGGRDYYGSLLFNRASSMQNQPASTIKPILSYALAIEYLGWNNNEVVSDEEYTYPGTATIVNNVDYNYLGNISLEEAIGYSRNTVALSTLEKVIDKVGVNTVIKYLQDIELLDVDPSEFNLSYALGAFEYGVSPVQMSSVYSMIARGGIYISPFTVTKVTLKSSNEVIYEHISEEKRVLSEETCFILSDLLKGVVDNNYYNIGTVKIKNVEIHAKTGTSSFDKNLLKSLNYPSNASKDIWFAGYSPDYSTVIWSGFDYPIKGQENYFKASSDSRKYIPRKIFYKIMNYVSTRGLKLEMPSSLAYVNVIKGTNFLVDDTIPTHMIKKAIYYKGKEPYEYLPLPSIDNYNLDVIQIGNQLSVNFSTNNIDDYSTYFDYSKIYGNLEYVIELTFLDNEKEELTSKNPSFSLTLNNYLDFEIKAYVRYSKLDNITSNIITKEFSNGLFLF